MRTKISFFRASDRALYNHNVHLIVNTRGRRKILGAMADSLIEHFREVDNYGLDKIRGVAVAEDHIHLLVAVPPNRSVAQVAHRLKGHASYRLLKENPELTRVLAGRGIWQRGYACKNIGPSSMGDLKTYLVRQKDIGMADFA